LQLEQALRLRPDWDDAINAQVVTLARLGRRDAALDVAEKAAARGVVSEELRHNVAELLGGSERGLLPVSVAAPLLHEPMATPAAVLVANPVEATKTTATLNWVPLSPHVLELQRSVPLGMPTNLATSPATPLPLPTLPRPIDRAQASVAVAPLESPRPEAPVRQHAPVRLRLEVSNGAGVAGLARGTAEQLRQSGHVPWRITNHSHYQVERTEIQYSLPEHAQVAAELGRTLGIPAILVESADVHETVQLRVLLGRDMARVASDAAWQPRAS
jgi:hypothetical protein